MQTHSSHSSQIQAKKRQSIKKSHSIIVNDNQIQQRYRALLSELELLLKKLHSNSLVLNYGTRVVTAMPCDIIRVLSEWPQNDSVDLTIRNIIISSILSAENKQVGSGIICAYYLLSKCEEFVFQKRDTLKNRAEVQDIDDVLSYMLGRGILYRLMKEVIHSGGLASELRFSYTRGNDFIVNTSPTQEILGEIHPLFETGIKEIDNPLVIAVDGTIESLGEIDHLLQDLSTMKMPAILMSRGFSPDIITTLDINWKNDKIKVIPFTVVSWDRDPVKMVQQGRLDDGLEVCESLGITCISTVTGDTLTNSIIDDFSTQTKVYFSKTGVLFPNAKGDTLHSEIKIPKRLKEMAGVIRDRCKISQKACIGVARSGICTEEIKTSHMTAPVHVSYAAEEIGIRSALSCKSMIKNMGSLIVS